MPLQREVYAIRLQIHLQCFGNVRVGFPFLSLILAARAQHNRKTFTWSARFTLVFLCVCLSACLRPCLSIYVCMYTYVCMYLCTYVSIWYVCMCVCMHEWRMDACMRAFVHVSMPCIHASSHTCMHVVCVLYALCMHHACCMHLCNASM